MIVATLSSRRLVGRAAELGALHDARRALSSGRGSAILVGGEAGIGKTRLLAEFRGSLSGGRAPHYALGECLADAPRPFGPFRAILATLLTSFPASFDDAPPLVRRALAALVPDALEALQIGFVTPAALEKTELFAGVLRYFELLAAKRAIVAGLEDLHWADSATLELLAHVAPRIGSARLLLLATYRDDEVHAGHPLPAVLARLAREQTVHSISLEPLSEAEVRSLIQEALGKRYVLEPEQIKDVIARGEGNPFFIEELVKKALEGREETTRVVLPISIRAMVLERVTHLSPDERGVLDHAAVFGARFDAMTLATVMRRSPASVLPALRRLRDINLVVEETSAPGSFRFRHALTRQTIYDDLLAVDTRSLHERIARSLEALGDEGAHVDGLAYHAWRAGLEAPALRYSERAGDAALAVGAAGEAATYFERALDLAADDETRIRLLGKSGEAYVQHSAFDEATKACMAQHALLVARGDLHAASLALTRAAGEFANGGQRQRAFDIIERFLDDRAGRLSEGTLDHLYASLARMATVCDDFERARAALAKVTDPAALPAFTHQVYWLARLFVAENDLDASGWKAAAAALRMGNPRTYPLMQSQMLHSIASTSIHFAEHAEGERAVDEAIAIDREFGFAGALAFANAVKACILCVQGRLIEARSCIQAALAEPDMFVVRLELAVGASQVSIALGDGELTDRCLDENVFRRVREAGAHALLPVMAGMRAASLYSAGRAHEALLLLNDAIEGVQHQFAAIHFWPFASRLADERGLARLRSLCAERARNPDDRVAQACAALLAATAARRSADPRSRELANVAAERYRALGWPLHVAAALECAGQTDEAIALYRECGNVTDVRRLEVRGPRPSSRNLGRNRLSPREREVATLIAQGFTNRAIADALAVGEKTVEKYVSAIYAKLSFSSRAQLAAYVARGEAGGS